MQEGLKRYLESFLTEERHRRVREVLAHRTRFLTVVLEDLSNPLNANAVIRTLDCFGIQDLHVIENKHLFERDKRTSKGTIKWVDVIKYNEKSNNSLDCVSALKSNGYKVITTSPHAEKTIHEIDFSVPTAIVFGNELNGVSEEIIEASDELVKLPMYGFAESFNISVSVALCLQTARITMENTGVNWQLSPEEYDLLYEEWLEKSVRNSDSLIKYYNEKNGGENADY